MFKPLDDASAGREDGIDLNTTEWNSKFMETVIVLSKQEQQEKMVPEFKQFARNQGFDLCEKMDKDDLTDKQKVAKRENQQIVKNMLEDVLNMAMAEKFSDSWSEEMGKEEPMKRQKVAECQQTVENILDEILSKVVMVTTPSSKTAISTGGLQPPFIERVIMQKISPNDQQETKQHRREEVSLQVKQDGGDQQTETGGQQDEEKRQTIQKVTI